MPLFINQKTQSAMYAYTEQYLPDGEWEDLNGNKVKTPVKPVEPKKETVNNSPQKEAK